MDIRIQIVFFGVLCLIFLSDWVSKKLMTRHTADIKPVVSLSDHTDRRFELGFDKKASTIGRLKERMFVWRVTLSEDLGIERDKDFLEGEWDATESAPDVEIDMSKMGVTSVDWRDPYSIRGHLQLYVRVRLASEEGEWWEPAQVTVR